MTKHLELHLKILYIDRFDELVRSNRSCLNYRHLLIGMICSFLIKVDSTIVCPLVYIFLIAIGHYVLLFVVSVRSFSYS